MSRPHGSSGSAGQTADWRTGTGNAAAAEVWSAADLPRLQPLLQRAPRVELEIGSGNGHFLAARSATCPDTLVIGTEIKSERCRKAARKLSSAKADNAVIIRARAEQVIGWLPPASLDAVHIYFPDPWPKRRHRRRRLLRRGVVEELARLLRPGGCLYLVTDFYDYYLQAVVLLLLHPDLVVDRNPARVPAHVDTDLSRYAPRLTALGKTIHYATGRRRCRSGAD